MSPAVDGWRRALALAGAVVAFDQVVKEAVAGALDPGERAGLVLGIDVANVRNEGIAFGLLGGGEGLLVVVTAVALLLVVGFFARHASRPWLWVPVGLLAGGALGNLADRVRVGSVGDFIDPPYWPAFNLADVAIVAGIASLLWVFWRPE